MINIFKMFNIGPRYSFGCPVVFTIASCGVLRFSGSYQSLKRPLLHRWVPEIFLSCVEQDGGTRRCSVRF